MKKDLKAKLINRKIKKPNPILMGVLSLALGFLNKKYKVKFDYDYNPKSLKGKPTILLASHSSRLEFIYMMHGFKRKDINMVVGYQNIIKKGLYGVMLSLGIISKYLYQPDVTCLMHMFKVLKRNGALGLFPEGIQSTSGSTHPINPATAQFIKRSKANVVVATSKGAYLATNRYSSDRKKGPISISYSLLFTPEQLENLSEKEIYDMILQKIKYNDFAYNKVARNKYIGKKPNAYGIDKILFVCPECKKEHSLEVERDLIKCNHCGFSVRVNEYYDLVDATKPSCPLDIDQWYKWQRRLVAKEIDSDGFEMTMNAKLCVLKTDKLRKSPKDRRVLSVGQAKLTKNGLSFKGLLDGKQVDFEFKPQNLYSLTCSTKGFLEFYYDNEYYMLIPHDACNTLIKWTLASEEINTLYNAKWRQALEDVFEYDKGESNE